MMLRGRRAEGIETPQKPISVTSTLTTRGSYGGFRERRAERPHQVLDIAQQPGLPEVAVDRALHDRAGVSPRANRPA